MLLNIKTINYRQYLLQLIRAGGLEQYNNVASIFLRFNTTSTGSQYSKREDYYDISYLSKDEFGANDDSFTSETSSVNNANEDYKQKFLELEKEKKLQNTSTIYTPQFSKRKKDKLELNI